MNIPELQKEILRLKKDLDVCVLAHSYQTREITEIADFTGDSFALSVKASKVPNKTVIMCGVRFMAETVKLLSPEKTVYLSNPIAGCPMAEQIDKDVIAAFKRENPDYTVVAYINTTTDLKTVCDVCVTSSSAVKIVSRLDAQNILFIPDCNLGAYVAENVPDKNIKLMHGGCPVHAAVRYEAVEEAKRLHPGALLLVHPECVPEVSGAADYVGSTAGIIDYAMSSEAEEFIIGTEIAIASHLAYECPGKKFYPLSKELICPNMKATTLVDVYNILKGCGGEEITLDEETGQKMTGTVKRVCIDRMIELG